MKIALLGAPGTSKTKIARRITNRLNTEPVNGERWKVIDGYVDKLRERTGRAFGAASDLQGSLMVQSERRLLEDEAAHKGINTITCGSIYETIIYGAAQSMLIPSIVEEQQIMEATHVAQITMQTFGILEFMGFDYDALFYLPLPTPKAETEFGWEDVINAKLPEVLEGFYRTAVMLDGTDRQKVDRATEIIRTIATTLTNPEQQTV